MLLEHSEYRREVYRPALDGLRAVSIVLVFFNHVQALPFDVCGWIGVWVFFVLSGYLIGMLLMREEDQAGRVDFRGFYVRRVGRIVPAYLAVIVAYLLLCFSPLGHGKGPGFLQSLPWFLTFSAELAPKTVAFGQAWTLGIEEKFYLGLPLVGFLLLRGRSAVRRGLIAGGIGVCCLINGRDAMAYAALLAGALMADALRSPAGFRSLSRLVAPPWWAYAAMLASAWTAARFHEALGLPPVLYLGWIALCSALVILDAMLNKGVRMRVLSQPSARRLGRLSYTFYLAHIIAINLCSPLMSHGAAGRVGSVVAALVLSFILAAILHYGVERPGIAAARRLLPRRTLPLRDADDVPLPLLDEVASAGRPELQCLANS